MLEFNPVMPPKREFKKLFSEHFYQGIIGIIEFNIGIVDSQTVQDTNPSVESIVKTVSHVTAVCSELLSHDNLLNF